MGSIVTFTGQSGSGKTSLQAELKRRYPNVVQVLASASVDAVQSALDAPGTISLIELPPEKVIWLQEYLRKLGAEDRLTSFYIKVPTQAERRLRCSLRGDRKTYIAECDEHEANWSTIAQDSVFIEITNDDLTTATSKVVNKIPDLAAPAPT